MNGSPPSLCNHLQVLIDPPLCQFDIVSGLLKYSMPAAFASSGRKSTGTKSIKFIRNTQTIIVSAKGPISGFLAEVNIL